MYSGRQTDGYESERETGQIYDDDGDSRPEVGNQAATLLLLAGIVMINMMLQSIGKGVKASITSSSRSGIFFIPAILILPHFFGVTGVEVAQAVADVCSIFLAMPLAISELRHMRGDGPGRQE